MGKRIIEPISAKESLDIISKQWLSTKDIQKLGCVGESTALKIKKEIIGAVENSGYHLPFGFVPSELIVDYFNININYLKKVAKESGK